MPSGKPSSSVRFVLDIWKEVSCHPITLGDTSMYSTSQLFEMGAELLSKVAAKISSALLGIFVGF